MSLGREDFDPKEFGYEQDNEVSGAVHTAGEMVKKAILKSREKNNQETIAQGLKQREDLMKCFPEIPFHVELLPNGYCSEWCCTNLPWYRCLTRIGWVKIGWRKSVINIDWSDTVVKESGEVLFPGASFTVGSGYSDNQYCHAWGYDKATEQLAVIFKARA